VDVEEVYRYRKTFPYLEDRRVSSFCEFQTDAIK